MVSILRFGNHLNLESELQSESSELCNPLGSEDLKFAIWNLKLHLKFEIGNWNLQFPVAHRKFRYLNHYEPSSQ